MTNAAIYARISRDKSGAGIGVSKQDQDCRNLAGRLSLDVVGVYTDNDLTALKTSKRYKGRAGFDSLLENIRAGRVDAVLCWHTDRLLRDMGDLETYITACRIDDHGHGIPTYTVQSGEIDLSNATGRMMARIRAAVQQQEVEHMIERIRNAKERDRQAGVRNGGNRPFGYRPDGPPRSAGGTGGYKPVPDEAALIREAYDGLLAGTTQPSSISRKWNDAGYRTMAWQEGAKGGPGFWTPGAVRDVMLRAVYAGLVEHPRGSGKIVGAGKWEPIISEDQWRAARAFLTDPVRRTSPGPAPKWLLTGKDLMICGVCNRSRFRVLRDKRSGCVTYYCQALMYVPEEERGGLRRHHLGRLVEPLDEHVEKVVRKRLGRPDVVAAINATPEVDVAALDVRRQAINAELNELAAATELTVAQLQIRSKPLIAELGELDRQISAALRGVPVPEFQERDPVAAYDAMGLDRKRAVILMLMEIRLLPIGKAGRQKGSKNGERQEFRDDSVEITWKGRVP